ncbi:MAG: hypothetical protein J0J06_14005 [Sphingomonas sp.]|uniref:hypothetical protein n=1 Tax=Sphingomonas sp. TaxID=28214 RepID=UPI001AC7C1A0|nr:hypothetical protein [Sphingomonas sp.]MBN8816549.1 hypothetical protein [Sphingomonas sp.]
MDHFDPLPRDTSGDSLAARAAVPTAAPSERTIVDRLADSFPLERSESEWLLTLLSADELRYIFEGLSNGENSD